MPQILNTQAYLPWLGRKVVKSAGNGWVVMPTVTTSATTTAGNWWPYDSTASTNAASQMYWVTNQQIYTPTWSDIAEANAYERDRWVTGEQLLRQYERQEARIAAPAIIRQRTPEQIAQEEFRLLQHKEREREKLLAAERAEAFLVAHLTPEQQKTFKENKWFIVEGGKTKTKYRIQCHGSFVGNVDVLDERQNIKHRLCAHVETHQVPRGDNWLAQKAMLEWDEEHFVKTANVHRVA